jgi:hypothetical protein
MVIDFRKDASHALRFAVFDAATGQRLDHRLAIFYADDEAGVIKHYRRLPAGAYVGRDGLPEVIEERRKIDIVRKV